MKLLRKEKEYISLPKDGVYIFCHNKKQVIPDEKCDYYEHNKKCDETKDYIHRTHSKHTFAGYRIRGYSGMVLNQCNYCIEHNKKEETYVIPPEVRKYFPKE